MAHARSAVQERHDCHPAGGAALLSRLLGHALEAVVIAVIVLFAVLLGFIQEYRAARVLAALSEQLHVDRAVWS